MQYAIINAENIVTNVVEWDGVSEWGPPEGHQLIEALPGDHIEPGGIYDQITRFSPAPPPVLTLDEAKVAKVAEIDAKTDSFIDQGFEYPPASGVYFSLSLPAQSKLMALEIIKDDPVTAYPIEYNSKNDKAKHSMADANDAHNFFLQALGTVRAYLDSGTALKDAVRAATTVAEVEAIVDPR